MTSIRIYDPAEAGTALPELPPLPIGALAVGVAELLQQAASLPAPTSITIYHTTQHVSMQFDPDKDSIRAITRWAARFGSAVTVRPGTVDYDTGSDTGTWYRTQFDYYGITVEAFAFIPDATGEHP